MAATPRKTREAKKRIQQMEAKRELRKDQEQRRKRDNAVAAGVGAAAVVIAVVLQLTVFAANPTEEEFAATEAGITGPSATASPTPEVSPSPPVSPSAAAPEGVNSPLVPSADLAAGKTLTGQLILNGRPVGVELNGSAAPQAASVLKSLSDQGYFNGKICHRLTTAEQFGLLQCGSSGDAGTGGAPNYSWGPLENTPPDNLYPAGTIAMARTPGNAYGNSTQFFIVYKDSRIPADSAGGYTVVGRVTSGLDVVTAIAAAGITPGNSETDGTPVQAVTIDSFSLQE